MRKVLFIMTLLMTMLSQGAWADPTVVASIGETEYTALQAAFAAAETGQTIKLLSDVTQAGGVGKSDGKAVTFDLNGHIYTCTDGYGVMAVYNSQITIIDSSTDTPGGIKSESALVSQENGKIIIKAGRYNIGDLTATELLEEAFSAWGVEMYSGYTLQDITPADAQGFCVGVVAAPAATHDITTAEGSGGTGWTIPTSATPGQPVTVTYTGQHRVKSVRVRGIPRVTAPTAVEDALTYNTTAQTLFNAGSTNLGTLKYKVTTTNTKPAITDDGWDTTIPTQTNGGTYYLWYYVDGGENNKTTEVNGTAVTKDINKAAGAISYSEASVTKEYNASAFTNTLTNTGDGTVTYSRSSGANVCTVNASSGQVTLNGSAGTCTITATVTDGDNYTYATTTASYTLTVTPPLASVTSAHVGYYVCTDGTYYSPSTAVPSGKTVAGMIAYVSSKGHGLIIAKTDAYNGNSGDYSTMENACRNYTPTITAGGTTLTWKLPSKTEFENMGADQNKTITTRIEALSSRGFDPFTKLLYLTSKIPNSDTYWRYAPNAGNWSTATSTSLVSWGRACASFDF